MAQKTERHTKVLILIYKYLNNTQGSAYVLTGVHVNNSKFFTKETDNFFSRMHKIQSAINKVLVAKENAPNTSHDKKVIVTTLHHLHHLRTPNNHKYACKTHVRVCTS